MERQHMTDAFRPDMVVTGARPEPRYLMLAMIDEARGGFHIPFATDANAHLLERLADELTDRYWGEVVWQTGSVPAGAFHRVCNELERFRLLFAQLSRDTIVSAA